MVGNLGGKTSRVSGSSSDHKDCIGDDTIREPSDIVEQPRDSVPGVYSFLEHYWRTVEGPHLFRLPKESYLNKPKLTKRGGSSYDFSQQDVLQLTRFDDFVVLGNTNHFLGPSKVIDIVRENASQSADVIAAQLVKGVIEEYQTSVPFPITFVVILLDHEILLREHQKKRSESFAKMIKSIPLTSLGVWVFLVLRLYIFLEVFGLWEILGMLGISQILGMLFTLGMLEILRIFGTLGISGILGMLFTLGMLEILRIFGMLGIVGILGMWRILLEVCGLWRKLTLKRTPQSIVLRDDKKTTQLKEKERITTLKKKEKMFASEMKDKKGSMMGEDHKMKILLGEIWPNDRQVSMVSLEENEHGMESATISSNLPSAEMQDDFEASSSAVLIEDDDWKSEDFVVLHDITKWIIYGDHQERTLLCFFNVEEKQFEFYFEDHESMATIIGLGVLHSKVVLKCGSLHVTVVEILKEDWNVIWTQSNDIPPSIPEYNVSKQESFPNILHRIANIVISKANNGGVGGDNGKDKAQGNANDRKGKGKVHDYGDHVNDDHSDGGSNGLPDDNDKKERNGKDGNDEKNDGCDGDNGKTSNGDKEIQAIVYLRLWPGGVLEEKEKKKGHGEVHMAVVEGNKKEPEEIHAEAVKEKKEELGKVHEEVEKKKKFFFSPWWCAFK